MLVEASQHTNIKLREIAQAVVTAATGGQVPDRVVSGLRTAVARRCPVGPWPTDGIGHS